MHGNVLTLLLNDIMMIFLKLLMYIFKLLIQIQISLSIGNLYLADKVTHIVKKFIQKKKKKKNCT